MTKIFVLSGLIALSGATSAWAQTPPAPSTPPANGAGQGGGKDGAAQGGTATNETYKMKDGGMYQPPAQRPASPAMDMSIYGRT